MSIGFVIFVASLHIVGKVGLLNFETDDGCGNMFHTHGTVLSQAASSAKSSPQAVWLASLPSFTVNFGFIFTFQYVFKPQEWFWLPTANIKLDRQAPKLQFRVLAYFAELPTECLFIFCSCVDRCAHPSVPEGITKQAAFDTIIWRYA